MRTGFEPASPSVKSWCPRPLDDRTIWVYDGTRTHFDQDHNLVPRLFGLIHSYPDRLRTCKSYRQKIVTLPVCLQGNMKVPTYGSHLQPPLVKMVGVEPTIILLPREGTAPVDRILIYKTRKARPI